MRTSRKPRHTHVPATEAAKTFGRLVDRVREERATYVIERGGKPVAQITPLERRSFTFGDLKALTAALPRADADYLGALERGLATRNKPKVRANPWAR
ncbi:MAG TPA: type II toxin-antitoxin system Phd/YefM family antitoxin [Vicinamibacterales bacterium]|nr:type II toxin-antitoxin system Phd/YefM family antitoxin [Vicinamibacterales bacterium]